MIQTDRNRFLRSASLGATLGVGATALMSILAYMTIRATSGGSVPWSTLLLSGATGGVAGNLGGRLVFRFLRGMALRLGWILMFSLGIAAVFYALRLPVQRDLVTIFEGLGLTVGSFVSGGFLLLISELE